MDSKFEITVADAQSGTRLDRFLASALPDISRSRLKALIKAGQVLRHIGENHQPINSASVPVKMGEIYSLTIPEAEDADPVAEDIPLDIIFEDDDLVVVNKVAGMVVHPAAGSPNGTLVNALLHHCAGSLSGIGGIKRPGIVHRIDKDTSGLLVVAKHDKAHIKLSEQFADHSVERLYSAVCRGLPSPPDGRIEGALARHPKDRKKMAITDKGGKWAVTHYRSQQCFYSSGHAVASLIECQLETGRTHQVRVHMASLSNPLIGDPIYGNPGRLPSAVGTKARAAVQSFKRQALHARTLGFFHPISAKPFKFECALPHDMQSLLDALKAGCSSHDV